MGDYDEFISSYASIFKKSSFKLFTIATISLTILIIFLIFCKSYHLDFNIKPGVCMTDECLRSVVNLKFSMNLSVNPCDDFYHFTCGNWVQSHLNHAWSLKYDNFEIVAEKLLTKLNIFLTSTPKNNEPEAITKLRNFYKSCMDFDTLDNLGLSVMYKYIKSAGLPIVPRFFTKTKKFDWLKTAVKVQKMINANIFFGFNVEPNLFNTSQNVMYFGTSDWKSSLPSPYEKEPKPLYSTATDENQKKDDYKEKKKIAKMFKFIVKDIMKDNSMEEPNEDTLDLAANLVNDISSFLQETSQKYSVNTDDFKVKSKIIVDADKDIHKIHNYSKFYSTFIEHMFEDVNITIDPEKDRIYFLRNEDKYIVTVLGYVLKLTHSEFELYLWWVTVYSMILNTSYEFSGPKILQELESRSRKCTIHTEHYMGMAASYVLADRYFKNSTILKVEKILKGVKTALFEQIKSNTWMDQETKDLALEKVNATLAFIGYPDWLFNNGSIDEIYKNVEINSSSYLDNLMNLVHVENQKSLSVLSETTKNYWIHKPLTANAFNDLIYNKITIPMAVLIYPMYNFGVEYLNYGSAGFLLGHELTHSLGNTGRLYNKHGNRIKWWTDKTIKSYENITQCLVDQFNNFTIGKITFNLDGKKTLNENISDNGGLHQAFKAYQKYVKNYGQEDKLPGFENFTNEQMFFIAFGNYFCDASNEYFKIDTHPLNFMRVIGSVQNSEEFAKAFSCPKGSPMNPDRQKCEVW